MSKIGTRLGLAAAVATAVLVAAASSFAVTAKPSITKFTPTTAKPGAMVTITGKDLTGVKAVEFNGLKATFKALSATKLTAKVPSKATSGKITVVTTAGTAVSSTALKI